MIQRLRSDLHLPRNIRRSIERAGNPIPGQPKPKRCARICGSKEMTAREIARHKRLH